MGMLRQFTKRATEVMWKIISTRGELSGASFYLRIFLLDKNFTLNALLTQNSNEALKFLLSEAQQKNLWLHVVAAHRPKYFIKCDRQKKWTLPYNTKF